MGSFLKNGDGKDVNFFGVCLKEEIWCSFTLSGGFFWG